MYCKKNSRRVQGRYKKSRVLCKTAKGSSRRPSDCGELDMKKRVKKQKSILQNQENKQCYLCMLQEGNYAYQTVEDHHIFFGSNRRNSELYGFKVNLCIRHHRTGKEAVHLNRENDLILKKICQREYERTHTRQEFVQIIGKSYLGGGFERA